MDAERDLWMRNWLGSRNRLDLLRLYWVDWSYNTQVTYTMLAISVIKSKFSTAIVKQSVLDALSYIPKLDVG